MSNVIEFPNKDRVLCCLNTIVDTIKSEAQQDDPYYQITMLEALLEFWESYDETLETMAIKQSIHSAIVNIIHFSSL